MKNIIVANRQTINQMPRNKRHIIISITTDPKRFVRIDPNVFCEGLLQVAFADIDDNEPYDLDGLPEEYLNEARFIDADIAAKIWKFVQKHSDVPMIICQCDAGISRSAGVAAALSKILNGDDSIIFESKLYKPNRLVYNEVMCAAGWDTKPIGWNSN